MSTAFASPNVTFPGPLTLLHTVVTVPGGFGSPSSPTVPSSDAVAGSVMDRLGPASTDGGAFGTGYTTNSIVSAATSAPSSAASRRM